MYLSCHKRETKKVPMRNRTSDLRTPRSDALPLRDSIVSEAHYEVQVRHAACVLLGSAMSLASRL